MQTPPAEKAAGKEVKRRKGERIARRNKGFEEALFLRAEEPSQRKIEGVGFNFARVPDGVIGNSNYSQGK